MNTENWCHQPRLRASAHEAMSTSRRCPVMPSNCSIRAVSASRGALWALSMRVTVTGEQPTELGDLLAGLTGVLAELAQFGRESAAAHGGLGCASGHWHVSFRRADL